ncbi:U3 small nucleolar RNA-associated protein 4 homolog [Mercenaria mercenaria]|uniref:U3 small nucleolar RNA-associated protein 4 homolog n=1 Tax=Mercenaria mercenaria TaxID=6596 RepID=UPI00234EA9D8|nr:U3 small nucleolar RNA-associated protein 4 homolog [Mercenaria mercenaria]
MGEFRVHHVRFFEWTPKSIQCMSYSSPNQKLALSRCDGSIELWSVRDGWYQEEVIPGVEDQSIEDLVWQGTRLFSAGLDGHIREVDLVRLNIKKSCPSNAGPVWCLTSNSAGTRLAAGTEDGCVVLLDTEYNALEYLSRFDSQESRILCISWHSGEDVIVTGGIDNIRVWSVSSGKAMQRLTVARTDKNKETVIWSVICLSDMTIVSGDSRGKTSFWNGKQGTLIKLATISPKISFIVNSNMDYIHISRRHTLRQLVSSYRLEFVSLTIAALGNLLRDWIGTLVHNQHTHDVRAVQIINKSIVTGGVDTNLIQFSLTAVGSEGGHRQKSHENKWKRISAVPQKSLVKVARDVNIILLQYTYHIEVWRLGFTDKTGANGDILTLRSNPIKLIQLKTKGGAPVFCCGISHDATLMAYSDCETVRLYNINLENLKSIQPSVSMKRILQADDIPPDGAHCLCFTSDKTRLVTVTSSSCVQICSIQHGKVSVEHTFPELSDNIHLLDVSRDDTLTAVADHDCNVHVYSLESLQHVCSVPRQNHQVSALSFSPDSKMLVMAYTNQKIFEFDISQTEFSDWSKRHSQSFMKAWLRRKSKISKISYNPSNDTQLFLHDEQLFCILDKTQKFPGVKSFEELKLEKTTAFHICMKYKFLFHLEVLQDNWLIAVERPQLDMYSSLPEALKRKKFGT